MLLRLADGPCTTAGQARGQPCLLSGPDRHTLTKWSPGRRSSRGGRRGAPPGMGADSAAGDDGESSLHWVSFDDVAKLIGRPARLDSRSRLVWSHPGTRKSYADRGLAGNFATNVAGFRRSEAELASLGVFAEGRLSAGDRQRHSVRCLQSSRRLAATWPRGPAAVARA